MTTAQLADAVGELPLADAEMDAKMDAKMDGDFVAADTEQKQQQKTPNAWREINPVECE